MTYAEILRLPPAERLELIEAIWDSLDELPEAIPVSDEVRDELDRRLDDHRRDPETVRPWGEVRDELFGRK